MSMLNLMERFHTSVLEDDASHAMPDIKPNARISPEAQMAIYQSGYRIRLINAIRSDYPALLSLIGGDAFDTLAREYIDANPPSHFNLDRYPHDFANFVQGDAFAQEVAALEAAVARVFMGEESAPLVPEAMTEESFGAMTLRPRAASALLALTYPVNDWFDAQRAGNDPARPMAQASYLYIYRHKHSVRRAVLPEAAFALLERLFEGLPLEAALESMLSTSPAYADQVGAHLQAWFTEWTREGFFRE